MWQRFTLYDIRVIAHYLGVLVLFSTVIYAIPFCVALILCEWEPASRYLTMCGVNALIGLLLRFACMSPRRLSRQQALAVTGISWILLAIIASIPLYQSGHYLSYSDALFDGVSGLTTTGASVINDLEHLSYADNMFRFMMHLFGGLGLIVVALSFGLFGKGGASLYAAEARSEHVIPNVIQTARLISRITVLFVTVSTIIVALLCFFDGMNPLRAFLHALWVSISGFVTGGFTPTSQSIMYYHSFSIELVLMILMICGAINFALHLDVWNGHIKAFFQDIEMRTMALWLMGLVFVFTASLSSSSVSSDLLALLRRGLFTIIAAFSTAGFQNVTTNAFTTVFTSGVLLMVAVAMAIGGAAGSTAGGIKLFRMGIVFKSIVATIKETLAPDTACVSISYNHLGKHILTPEVTKEAMTVFLLYVITFGVGTVAGIAAGYDAVQAVFEAISMASNGGLVSGIVSPGMPTGLELVYIFEMWAGRLEFVTLLALIVKIFASLFASRSKSAQKGGSSRA